MTNRAFAAHIRIQRAAKVAALALLAVAAFSAPVMAELTKPTDWPEFRGPGRDGKSPEAGWRKDFEGAPPVLWSKSIGIGYSQPVVVDGKCYTMGANNDVDTVYCFDAETGADLWSKTYAAPTDGLGYYGPRATPTVDANMVYTLSLDGQLYAWDAATGEQKWQYKFTGEAPRWGFSCSPLVVGDLLILDMGPIVALNKKTGQEVWKTEAFTPGYSSPALFTHEGKQYIAAFPAYGLVIVSPDGKVVAKTPWETRLDCNVATPIYRDGKIFISSGYRTGGALYTFDGTSLTQVYKVKEMQNQCNSSVLVGDYVYGFNGDVGGRGELTCMRWADGEILWQERGLGTGSLIFADETLIVLGEEGDLVLAQPTPEAQKITAKMGSIGGICWTSPTLSHGRLYLRNYKRDRAKLSSDLVVYDLRPAK